jgi:hypothetical protein
MKRFAALFILFACSAALTQAQTIGNCSTILYQILYDTLVPGPVSDGYPDYIASESVTYTMSCKTTNASTTYPANTRYFGPVNTLAATATGSGANPSYHGFYPCNPKFGVIARVNPYYVIGRSGMNYLQINPFDGVYEYVSLVGSSCTWTLGTPTKTYCQQQACQSNPANSPIIVDVSGKGFFLTDAQQGVWFDIAGSGKPIKMAWTANGAQNAFLTLPGPDGLVHSGKELFGNFTPQPASTTPNGFAALAVYDDNHDGVIDARDAVFQSLRLWIDENHDGISQPEELHTLAELGVTSISLKYKDEPWHDQYGNAFRYRARVNDDTTDKWTYDVFFVSLCK